MRTWSKSRLRLLYGHHMWATLPKWQQNPLLLLIGINNNNNVLIFVMFGALQALDLHPNRTMVLGSFTWI